MNPFSLATPFGPKQVEIKVGESWEILSETISTLRDRPVEVIIDNRVDAFHGQHIQEELNLLKSIDKSIVISNDLAKEISNSIPLIEKISQFLPASKDSALIAIGGGSILNIGGFIASAIGRGIDFYAVPTTPMAIADVAFGSKHALNTRYQKNYIGSYWNPVEILINEMVLASIDTQKIKINCIESLKQFIATSKEKTSLALEVLETETLDLKRLTAEILIPSALQKMSLLSEDPKEEGVAGRILMIGHHIAHSLEGATRFKIGHDRAVAIGILIELQELARRGILNPEDLQAYESTLTRLGIEVKGLEIDIPVFRMLMERSKLRVDNCVLLLNICRFGEIASDNPFTKWDLADAINATESALNS